MKDAILAFGRAVFWGSAAGGGPFMLLTVPIAIAEIEGSHLGWVFWMAVLPMAIAGPVVVLATIGLGLPLTALLRRLGREDRNTYVTAGLLLGILLPIVALYLSGDGFFGMYLSIPGALAGSVTAAIWGGWRERVAENWADAF